MKKILLIILSMLLLLAAGCTQKKDFSYGVSQMEAINSKYNITFDSYPADVSQLDAISSSYNELKNIKLAKDQAAFNELIDYHLLSIEAEKDFVRSLKYGDVGTTKNGFVCKSRPIIIETVGFKNASAIKGFDAVSKLKNFIDNYPENANSLNLSQKNVVFMNATYYELSKDANSDSDTVNGFCPENLTLEVYKAWFRKNTNLSDEYISNLNYNQAVSIWKKEVGAD